MHEPARAVHFEQVRLRVVQLAVTCARHHHDRRCRHRRGRRCGGQHRAGRRRGRRHVCDGVQRPTAAVAAAAHRGRLCRPEEQERENEEEGEEEEDVDAPRKRP